MIIVRLHHRVYLIMAGTLSTAVPRPRRESARSTATLWSFSESVFVVVQLLRHVWLCDPMNCTPGSCPPLSPGVCSDSCPLSWWCHPTISSSVAPFSSCPQSFPAPGSFPMSQLFTSRGQSIGASASVLPMNVQGWFPLGWTGWISLQSKGPSRVFSNTTVQNQQFFSTQPSLWSNCHIHTWPLEKPWFDYMDLCWQSDVSAF